MLLDCMHYVILCGCIRTHLPRFEDGIFETASKNALRVACYLYFYHHTLWYKNAFLDCSSELAVIQFKPKLPRNYIIT